MLGLQMVRCIIRATRLIKVEAESPTSSTGIPRWGFTCITSLRVQHGDKTHQGV